MSLIIAIAAAAATPMPCPKPTHHDGDDIRCDSPYWRGLAGKGGMRLHVIDAPEVDCRGRRKGPCITNGGIASRDHLRRLTKGRAVRCSWTGERTGSATGDRPVVECTAAGVGDLGCAQWRAKHAGYVRWFDRSGRFKQRCA